MGAMAAHRGLAPAQTTEARAFLEAKTDVLAKRAFLLRQAPKLPSINPRRWINNGEIKHRIHVVGIFNENAIVRLVGAILQSRTIRDRSSGVTT